MKKISNWIVCLGVSLGQLSAAWNPSVDIAGPPISTEAGQGSTGPVLTVNSLNNGIVVFGGRDPFDSFSAEGNIYASSYNFGTGWTPTVTISDTTIVPPPDGPYRLYINQEDPDVMMNDSGYAVAVWEGSIQQLIAPQNDVFDIIISSTRSSDGVWSPVQIVRIQDPIDFVPQNPSVAVNESGLAVTMWNERRGDSEITFIMASFLPQGGTWTTPVVLDAPGVSGVRNIAGDVELNDNGNAVAVWQIGEVFGGGPFRISAATYDPLTDLWTTVVLDADPGNRSEFNAPEAAIDPSGNAVVVWNGESEDGSFSEIAAASYSITSGWGPTVILYSEPANLGGPYVVMDHLGTATAIWSNFSGVDQVFSSRLPLGGTWSAPEVIAVGAFDPFSVQEAASVDAQGNVIAIIFGPDDNLQSVLRTVQGGWQAPENIFNDDRNVQFPNIGLGSCGFALAAWKNNGDNTLGTRFVQGADNFSLTNYFLAPANFVGSRCCEKFASQTACLVNLSWDPVDCALFYYIRRNGELIATIPAGGSTIYRDLICSKNQGSTYTLSAVNIYGIESPGVTITVP